MFVKYYKKYGICLIVIRNLLNARCLTLYGMHARDTNQSAEGKEYSKPYSSGRALAGGFLLSAMLWWIPILGPATAGFYTGRRSGSFMKGLITSVLAGGILFFAVSATSHYILGSTEFHNAVAGSAFGFLAEYVVWAEMYLESFFHAGTMDIAKIPFGILVIFGGVGGSFSALHRREAIALMADGAVHSAIRPLARSVELYERGKELGFESFDECITIKNSVMSFNLSSNTPKGRADEKNKVQTFQTNTTASGRQTLTTMAAANSKSSFSDILANTEIRNGKE